jgi:hypothetical protein|tara:strand:- start:790 stop:1239 length:450 start_codon:yes stop_codon:yes gene_type:complete
MKGEDIAESFEAKKYAYRQTKDGMVLSFVLHPDDVPKEMATAPIGQRYMVACAQIDDHENPIRPRATTDAEKALARANLICRDETYIQWVRMNYYQWDVVDETLEDEEYAAQVIRFICGIESRSELKTNPEARERLNEHLKLFESEVQA